VPVLARELARGAAAGAVRTDGDPRGASVLVYVLAGESGEEDESALRQASRARTPVVVVAARPLGDAVPFVPATHVVPVPAGEGFPVEDVLRTAAAVLGEDGAPLAARVPLLRRPVADRLVESFARRNGLVGAAVFLPGADLPLLALNQLRLLLRLEQAYGLPIDRERLPELLATVAAGFGLRALARELLDLVPVAGWAVKGAVAYGGTRALGEAAVARLESRGAAPG
jgi:uncharacterized protein (DUF697 family)